mgnify:FL=1
MSLWYSQSIGIITSYAEYTSYPDLYNKITQYVGREGFILLKISYYALRSLSKLFDLTNLSNLAFIFCIFVNLFFILKVLKKKIQISHEEKKILFVSILGLSGFIQSFMLFEVFRNINATIGIFITLSYLYKNKDASTSFLNKNSKKTLLVISIYLITLLLQFPYQNYNDKDYTNFNNSYFSDSKKVKLSIKKYYEELSDYLCEINDISIINDTADNAIPYLCNNRFIKSKLSIEPLFLKTMKPSEHERLIIKKILNKNEIYLKELEILKGEISYNSAPNTNMKLLKVIKTGHSNPYLYGDIHIHGTKNN